MNCYSLMTDDYLVVTAIQKGDHTPLEAELLARFEKALDLLANVQGLLVTMEDHGLTPAAVVKLIEEQTDD